MNTIFNSRITHKILRTKSLIYFCITAFRQNRLAAKVAAPILKIWLAVKLVFAVLIILNNIDQYFIDVRRFLKKLFYQRKIWSILTRYGFRLVLWSLLQFEVFSGLRLEFWVTFAPVGWQCYTVEWTGGIRTIGKHFFTESTGWLRLNRLVYGAMVANKNLFGVPSKKLLFFPIR